MHGYMPSLIHGIIIIDECTDEYTDVHVFVYAFMYISNQIK